MLRKFFKCNICTFLRGVAIQSNYQKKRYSQKKNPTVTLTLDNLLLPMDLVSKVFMILECRIKYYINKHR